ncbi:MAG: mechanosensitive ion channel [Bacteroidales bacterium]
MPLSSILPTTAVSDSTAHTTINATEKIQKLASMSGTEIFSTIIDQLVRFGLKLALAVAVLMIGRWLINRIDKLCSKLMEKRHVDLSLRTFLESLVKIALNITLVIIIIGVLGIDTSSFLALFASAGVAIGMALSGTLQNFAGGVMILLFKPYKVGDFIEAQGQTGTVKQIQIINTVLNTVDNKVIIIPNGSLSTGIINNYSKEGVRRIDWTFGIAYGDDYDTARTAILNMLKEDKRVFQEPAPFVAFSSLGDISVYIVVRAWANLSDYWDIYFLMNERVYKEFPRHNLNIPFPQMDVHLHQSNN